MSAVLKPDVIARHGELASTSDRRSAVALLSVTVGIRDMVSGIAIVLAPAGGALLAVLGARVAFGRLLPTRSARRKVAAIAVGWGAISALAMIGAGG